MSAAFHLQKFNPSKIMLIRPNNVQLTSFVKIVNNEYTFAFLVQMDDIVQPKINFLNNFSFYDNFRKED
jgi:hypothetical protein